MNRLIFPNTYISTPSEIHTLLRSIGLIRPVGTRYTLKRQIRMLLSRELHRGLAGGVRTTPRRGHWLRSAARDRCDGGWDDESMLHNHMADMLFRAEIRNTVDEQRGQTAAVGAPLFPNYLRCRAVTSEVCGALEGGTCILDGVVNIRQLHP